jgi:glucose-6-phosphate isomerase
MIHINAYHQPGVEAGKLAAGQVIEWQVRILELLETHPNQPFDIEAMDAALGGHQAHETLYKICQHLAANPARRIRRMEGASHFEAQFSSVA